MRGDHKYVIDEKMCYKSLDFLGFPDYRVGDDGSVWTRKIRRMVTRTGPWRRMKTCPNYKGYLLVRLCNLDKQKVYQVHRLVLLAFVGPCPQSMLARHFPNQDPQDNRLENLSWSTPERNQQDRVISGKDSRGEKSGKAKLTKAKVLHIRQLIAEGVLSLRAIGRKYGVSVDCIIDIRDGRTWWHLTKADFRTFQPCNATANT
mgnify:FL=1